MLSNRAVIALLGMIVIGGFGGSASASGMASDPTPAVGDSPVTVSETDPVLLAAGDIADCDSDGDEATAKILDGVAGTIATLGDHAYDDGTDEEFADCYDPTWGRHKDRTRPVPGNHDYGTRGAAGYFRFFGNAAGEPGQGYYSYDLGTWHVVALNSNCRQAGGCAAGSEQEQWLRADLAAHPAACTLAYWHHPRFSSGVRHGSTEEMAPLWQALVEAGAEVVLAGHDHHYERFAPQDASGQLDPVDGIRGFVVGTGGRSLRGLDDPLPTTEVRNNDTFGVLKLTLHPTGYQWEFLPAAGGTFHDAGAADCH